MKTVFALILTTLLFVNITSAQDKPVDVPRYVYEIKNLDWYNKQAKLWNAELEKDKKNSRAWYNYYKAYRYSNFSKVGDKNVQQYLEKIVDQMEKYVPDSFEYLLLKSSKIPFGDNDRLEMLLKAYQLEPDNPQTYYDLLIIYNFEGKDDKARSIAKKLYKSKDIAIGLLNYNYNVIMSLDKNAILFTNGDNDTFPALLLQLVFKIRPDVTILNLSLSKGIPGYLDKKLDELEASIDFDDLPAKSEAEFIPKFVMKFSKKYQNHPIFFALTVYEKKLKMIKNDLYVIGLAYRYSTLPVDNIAEIKRNLNFNFRMDYLNFDWYEEDFPATKLVNNLNRNYMAPILILIEHDIRANEYDQAEYLFALAKKLAKKTAMDIDFDAYFHEKGIQLDRN